MSIYFFETSAQEQRYLEDRLPGEKLKFSKLPLTTRRQAQAIAEDAEVISVFIHSDIGPAVIDELPNLKLITTRSTGYDHINLPLAEALDIPVSNVPSYGENTVAEHTFAMILSLSRNIHKATARTAQGNFCIDGLTGFDLKGKTIGIIGTGHIGLHVARIAAGFGMKILATDPNPNIAMSEVLGYTYTSLKDLLNHSDVITLHAPLTTGTRNLIGDHNVDQIKRGALLINTARGGLVDTSAILRALDEGILVGAGLDVIEGEQEISEEAQLLDDPDVRVDRLKTALTNLVMLRRQDLIVTPHIAFDSREAIERILDTTVATIKSLRSGPVINTVQN